MSVDVVRRAYEAFDRDDLDAVVACFAEDIVWEQAQGLPHGGVYRGREQVRRHVFDPLEQEWWEEFAADAHEFIDAGEDVIVLGRYRGRGRGTGRLLDVPFVHVWTVRDGLAVRFRQFLDTAGWNAALGVGQPERPPADAH
jgi:hypothetical protein